MTSKPTNPKDAVGIRKAPLSCVSMAVTAEVGYFLAGDWLGAMTAVPQRPLFEVGLGMLEGARKYGRHNYRAVGVRASVYYDAFCRHMASFWTGEDIDPDSGLSHITKAMASLYVLRDAAIQHKLTDDRPPRTNKVWRNSFEDVLSSEFNESPVDVFRAASAAMLLWWEGGSIYEGSDLVVVALGALFTFRELMYRDGWVDPRPAPAAPGWLVPLNAHAGRLIDAKPVAEAPFTIDWQPPDEVAAEDQPCPS